MASTVRRLSLLCIYVFCICIGVAEICRDWHGSYPIDLQVDPLGPDNGVVHFKKEIFHFRVTRGGSWDGDNALYCRSAYRSAIEEGEKNNRTGFRIVLE